MNRHAILAALAATIMFVATVPAQTEIVAQTLFSDGTTNTWTQADLIAALQLINRKYHRDCERPEGRRAWHGNLVGQSVDTNLLIKTETYSDGTSFTFPFQLRTAEANVAAANARLATSMTKGVPTALAEARKRRQTEKATTNTVTVTVTK